MRHTANFFSGVVASDLISERDFFDVHDFIGAIIAGRIISVRLDNQRFLLLLTQSLIDLFNLTLNQICRFNDLGLVLQVPRGGTQVYGIVLE